ncbi:glycosyltransferase family 2 protein [Flavobacterium sp. LS2P90]|uniref:Glycosyltransferase family 2 protein n=1 Tax=Flavobacterium xylosi TaxID=3230415 RepID=A0ABW6HYM0_9FLAO
MLSILIPIYNYNAYPLVLELLKQCTNCGINFEILVIDDASTQHQSENNAIQFLTNCSFIELSENIGRSKIRNLLASKANYDWMLYLDCDTFPENSDFISNYIKQINLSAEKVFFGGIVYTKEKPANDKLLRWIFGQKREAIPLFERKKSPYRSTFVSNILIKKTVFDAILFDEKITNYGYEDFAFIQNIKLENIDIEHIENSVFHLNLETSSLFLSKTKTALETLLIISKTNSKTEIDSKIIKTHKMLYDLKINLLISKLFQKLQSRLERHLTSKKPSLLAFDCYKIGYFCYLNSK